MNIHKHSATIDFLGEFDTVLEATGSAFIEATVGK